MLPNVNFSTIHKNHLMSTEPAPATAIHDKIVPISSVEIVKNENSEALFGLSFLCCFLIFLFVYYLILKWVAKGNLDLPKLGNQADYVHERRICYGH